MTKVEEADVSYFLGRLKSANLEERAITLSTLKAHPIADERVAAALELLLDDRGICVLQLPYQFGEIRWQAAHALAAVRHALGKTGTINLAAVPGPINLADLAVMASEQKVPQAPKGSVVEQSIFEFDALRKVNALPLYDVALNLADPSAPAYRKHG